MSSNLPVLLVEDDGLIRMDLADILADNGFAVIEAPNADRALEVLETRAGVQALLTDIDMPGSIDGVALAHRTAHLCPDCKIVVISGRYKPLDGSLPDGARFLSKPILEEQLIDTLKELGIAP